MQAHAYRPTQPVNGPSPDACYELLQDVTVYGGFRFCLQPEAEHEPADPDLAICGNCRHEAMYHEGRRYRCHRTGCDCPHIRRRQA